MVDPLTQTLITLPPMPSKPVKEQGLFQKFRQIVVGEKHPSEELKELKKLIFQPPFIMSEDAGRFSRGMSCFQQYEKTAKPEGSHTDVNDILKVVQRNFQYIMVRDFPFYLLLAYRMHVKANVYMCNEHGNFILGCVDAMEAMKPHLIASTFNSFLQRLDFSIMFENESMGVFQLLEMACLELAKVATRRGTGQARMYTRFVFCRMMWVSLALKLRSERMIVTRSTFNIWKEYFTKHHQQITLSDDIISELKEGLEFGQLLHLPSDIRFNAQQMGDLLVSEDFVRPFWHIKQFVEVVESYIPLGLEFFNLVTTLRAVYDCWLRKTSSNKFSYVSITGTLPGALREGLEFLDSLAEVWERRAFNGQLFDAECVRWLLLLLWLVDITGQSPALHLLQFLKGRGMVKRYRQHITNYVIEETQKNFAKLTVQQFFPLFREFRIWPKNFLEEFLSGYQVPPHIRICDPTWREFFSEVVGRFTGAHNHHYLLGFLKSVAECYRNDTRAEELVLDLLQLGVPKLFASVGDGGEDSAVQQEMAAFLKDYINRSALKHSILSHMTKIMEAISEQRDEFQQLLLSVLQKEVVPEINPLQVTDNNLLPILHIAVNTLRKDLSWLQALTTRQQFCWGIVACCCSKIPISINHFEWAHTFSYLISLLGQIFHAYCSSKKLPEDERVLSSNPPQDILHSPSEDIKRYFEWIQRIQDVLLSWQERFLNHKVNYNDIMLYASYQAQLEELCSVVCVSVASLTAQNLQDVETTFLQQFEQLNVFLLHYISGQPDAHWCTLPSLLAEYGVALPPTLLNQISMYILFPGEERALAGKLLENLLSPTTSPTSQFQPGHEACLLRLSKKISLRSLSALVQELQKFLIPVIEHINVLVFFKLHHSEMFEKYLRLYFRKETAESETTPSHASAGIESFAFSMPVFSSMLPEEEQERDEAVEGLPLYLLERCLPRTVNLLLKMMDGIATYSEITAEGELGMLDIEQELNTITGFATFLGRSVSQQVLSGVQSMLELFQFTIHIQNIQCVCEQYHLQGCLEDEALHKLLTLVEELKSEANRANLTPLDASQRMLWVKESLCLDKKINYECLNLFTAVTNSAAFYQFVRGKHFFGRNGQEIFRQQYKLIAAQLDHEETILKCLFQTVKLVVPFMNTKQSFRELMTQVASLDASDCSKQLEVVNTNIALVHLWFSQAESVPKEQRFLPKQTEEIKEGTNEGEEEPTRDELAQTKSETPPVKIHTAGQVQSCQLEQDKVETIQTEHQPQYMEEDELVQAKMQFRQLYFHLDQEKHKANQTIQQLQQQCSQLEHEKSEVTRAKLQFEQQCSQLNVEKGEAIQAKLQLHQQCLQFEQEKQKATESIHQLRQQCSQLEQEKVEVTLAKQQIEHRCSQLDLEKDEAIEANLQFQQKCSQLEQENQEAAKTIRQLQQHSSQLEQEKGEVTQAKQQLEQQCSRLNLEKSHENQCKLHFQQQCSQLEQEKHEVTQVVQQLQQQCSQLEQERSEATRECSRLEQQLAQEREAVIRATEVNLQLQQEKQHLREECSGLERQLEQRVQSEDEFQQHLEVLKQRLHAALAGVQQLQSFPQMTTRGIDPWRVTRDEVEIQDEVDRGAWGSVYRGRFQGQVVAIKSPHPPLLNEHTIRRLQREVQIMAEVQHPNLLQFIGAVFDDETPLIIMELLDTNLRRAYQNGQLSDASKLPIFRDVAYALHYLHEQQDPIIHRDVSAPNVLLEQLPNGMFRAKVSDFGSANLARQAQTTGEGAIIYAAPETFPQAHNPDTPPLPQTTKIDVYSYGILVCEVIVQEQPDPAQYRRMLQQVQRQWLPVHELITSCTKHKPVDRLTMAQVLGKLTKISRSNRYPQPQN